MKKMLPIFENGLFHFYSLPHFFNGSIHPNFFRIGLVMLMLTGFSVGVDAQIIIENDNRDIDTQPIADDINVCFEQSDALSFSLVYGGGSNTNPMVSINLANGREYVDGTATITSQSGGPFTLGANTGDLTNLQFPITGTFDDPSDYVVISLNRVGSCDALGQNGLQDEVVLSTGESEFSTTHDALFLTLSIGNLNPVTAAVGNSETLTGDIIGGGNGCVEEFVFMLIDDAGLTTTAFLVEGNTIATDSIVGDT